MPAVLPDYADKSRYESQPSAVWKGLLFAVLFGVLGWELVLLWMVALG